MELESEWLARGDGRKGFAARRMQQFPYLILLDHPVETAARTHLRTEQRGRETTDKKQMRVHDAFGIVVGNFLVLTRLDRCTPIGSPIAIGITI